MPGAHHPGADHQRLAGVDVLVAGGSRPAPGDVLQVEEEGLDHVLRHRTRGQVDEVLRLDPVGGGEVDLGALDRRGEDVVGRRHGGALELLAQVPRERRQHHGQLRVRRRAARDLVPLDVPRLHRRRVGQDPGPGRRHHVVLRLDDLVDEARLECRARLAPLPLHQHLHERLLDAEHPHGADDAATAGEQAEGHLGEADLAAAHVDRDAVVAGQGQLEPPAERRAVDARDDRLAERLQPAEQRLEVRRPLLQARRVLLGGGAHHVQVGAGEEHLLAAGEDDAADVVLARLEPVDRRLEAADERVVEDVGALAGVVHRQHDDLVEAGLPLDHVGEGHVERSPSSVGVRVAR